VTDSTFPHTPRLARPVRLLAVVAGLTATAACGGRTETGAEDAAAPEPAVADMFIWAVMAPSESDCRYPADPTATKLGRGKLDLALTTHYEATLLIGNQLRPTGWIEAGTQEGSRVTLEAADVRLETADGKALGAFVFAGGAVVDPAFPSRESGGWEPGWGLFQTDLVTAELGTSLRSALGLTAKRDATASVRITAVVRVLGTTLGQRPVKTTELRYPIDVCYGCLVVFPPQANDPSLPAYNCGKLLEPGDTVYSSCIVGQDRYVDCRVCKLLLAPNASVCDP
jgi:hypothetical protein